MENRAELYPFISDKIITNPYEGLLIGNGDVAAIAVIASHELTLMLGKNDIWDSRLDNMTEEQVFRHDDLIRYTKEGFSWPVDCCVLPQVASDWPGRPEGSPEILYSCPAIEKVYLDKLFVDFGGASIKRAGQIRVSLPGNSETRAHSSVDISTGLLRVEYDLGPGKVLAEAFVHREKNTVALKLSVTDRVPWLRLFVEKEPDYADAEMPLPKVNRMDHFRGMLTQTIPGKFDVGNFSWHIACSFPGREQAAGTAPILGMAWAFRQDLNLRDGESAVLTAGIATDHDRCADSASHALELAGQSSPERFDEAFKESREGWRKFWAGSSVELDDRELESVWYRNMYGFACHLKPGAQAPSLCSNVPCADFVPFHGDYTWNHNVQKWYAPALVVNHAEWYDVFADLINQSIPMFEHHAQAIFGLPGVYCDLTSIPFVPPHRAAVNNKWGRALCMTGWLATMLFQHWEYTRDNTWLKKRAYEFIRKTAQFYAAYLKKYSGEAGDIFPSMRLEEPGWCKDFVGNTNVVTDLVMFRKALMSAAKASEILGIDLGEGEEWKRLAGGVPEIEYGWTVDGQGWYALCKDWDKVDSQTHGMQSTKDASTGWRIEYARTARWGGMGWLVYPGEHIDGDEAGGLADAVRDMLRRVDVQNPPNTVCKIHAISSLIPHIRLGITENFESIRALLLNHRYESGMFSSFSTGEGELQRGMQNWRIEENMFQGIQCVSEMLLQSQGDVLRLFPFLPESIGASFEKLRARGGFVVSARAAAGKGLAEAAVLSTAGGRCRVRWQGKASPVIRQNGYSVAFSLEGRDIVFETEKGREYKITVNGGVN